jgi:P-type E1-E2 ATPase
MASLTCYALNLTSTVADCAMHACEQIIAALNAAGRTTLMCGDGTNDVGALKRAHAGVSIVNSPELEKRVQVNITI